MPPPPPRFAPLSEPDPVPRAPRLLDCWRSPAGRRPNAPAGGWPIAAEVRPMVGERGTVDVSPRVVGIGRLLVRRPAGTGVFFPVLPTDHLLRAGIPRRCWRRW